MICKNGGISQNIYNEIQSNQIRIKMITINGFIKRVKSLTHHIVVLI